MSIEEYLVFLALMIASPLALIGVFKIVTIVMELIKVRQGCVKAYFITRNHRLRSYFAKPEAGQIKIRNKSFDYNDASGYVIQDGWSPCVFYNEKTAKQIDMTNITATSTVDPDHFSDLLIRSYNLGVTANLKKDNTQLLMFLILAGVSIVLIISLILVTSFSGYSETSMQILNNINSAIGTVTLS